MSEHNQQVAVVDFWKWQYSEYADCLVAIPNGTFLSGTKIQRAIQMKNLKREGFKPGASDLFFTVPRGTFHGMWLEMKDVNKTEKSLSTAQADHLELMEKMGYFACWAAGADAAIEYINNYMSLPAQ